MEKKTPRPMTPFDELTTPYPFSILKLLLPYLNPDGSSSLWIMVKFMELQYTISILKHPGQLLRSQSFRHFPDSPAELLDEITPYLPPEQAQMADTFHNALNMMEMMQMFQAADSFSGNTPDAENTDTTFSGLNPMDMMKGMLSPEQQEMFQMYQGMFTDDSTQENPQNTAQKDSPHNIQTDTLNNSKTGDDSYERMDEQSNVEKYGFSKTESDSDGGFPDEGEIR